jgi:hypothetical protein
MEKPHVVRQIPTTGHLCPDIEPQVWRLDRGAHFSTNRRGLCGVSYWCCAESGSLEEWWCGCVAHYIRT